MAHQRLKPEISYFLFRIRPSLFATLDGVVLHLFAGCFLRVYQWTVDLYTRDVGMRGCGDVGMWDPLQSQA